VDPMHSGHQHRRGGHAARAQCHAERAIARRGDHTVEYAGRPSSGS